MKDTEKEQLEDKLRTVIGNLLRIGIILSAITVIAGWIIYLSGHQAGITDFRQFYAEPYRLRNVHSIIAGAVHLHGRAVIQTGLLVLIATPIARVLFSFITFLVEKDLLYAAISLLVLSILLAGLLSGYYTNA